MIENMTEYIKEIRALVSERLDLTRDLSDDEIKKFVEEMKKVVRVEKFEDKP